MATYHAAGGDAPELAPVGSPAAEKVFDTIRREFITALVEHHGTAGKVIVLSTGRMFLITAASSPPECKKKRAQWKQNPLDRFLKR